MPPIATRRGASLSENSATQPESVGFEPFSAVLEALLERQSQQIVVPPDHKLLLTLTDAQALTGLSRAVLREAISTQKLKAEIIGRSWRIKRTDLEKYVEKIF